MATGTPRSVGTMPQHHAEGGNTWMSFGESPVHAGNPWTSFAEAIPHIPVPGADAGAITHLSSPEPDYIGQQRLAAINQIQTTSPAVRNTDSSSVLSRNGIGTETRSSSGLHHQHAIPIASHPVKATHGPGSTISHILRHESGKGEQDNAAKNQGDLRGPNMAVLHPYTSEIAEAAQQLPDDYYSSVNRGNENGARNPWFVTDEQGAYYRNQFGSMQSNLEGKIDGQTARSFFTKSRLPIPELSHIWELCDMDQDGHLTLLEFCAAFHLVVARKNGYELPAVLPKSLLPPLVKICGQTPSVKRNLLHPSNTPQMDTSRVIEPQKKMMENPSNIEEIAKKCHVSELKTGENLASLQHNEHNQWMSQEKWETFSDRTSSSTNLANFEQSLEHTDNLIHPVPLRITPSKHEAHSAKIRKEKSLPRSTDEDEQHLQKFTLPPSHKSLTNPYGSLKNDFSEADSHTSPRVRSSSNSSHSSAGTSDRSLPEIDTEFKPPKHIASDQEYQSDWSSRPLQPRSGSDSSIDGSALETSVTAMGTTPGAVPTPPPRPHQKVRSSKSDSFESDNHSTAHDVPDCGKITQISAPTPPPRPQQSTSQKVVSQAEGFADFSQFEKAQTDEPTTIHVVNTIGETELETELDQAIDAKPTPAPRYIRDEKPAEAKTNPKEEKSPDKNVHRKAPTKPPRCRILSTDAATQEHIKIVKSNSVPSPADHIPAIPEKPSQSQSKVSVQQSIRDLKLQNSQLTRLNADLQQELKDVMQSRITVEMCIHQLRPFTQ